MTPLARSSTRTTKRVTTAGTWMFVPTLDGHPEDPEPSLEGDNDPEQAESEQRTNDPVVDREDMNVGGAAGGVPPRQPRPHNLPQGSPSRVSRQAGSQLAPASARPSRPPRLPDLSLGRLPRTRPGGTLIPPRLHGTRRKALCLGSNGRAANPRPFPNGSTTRTT